VLRYKFVFRDHHLPHGAYISGKVSHGMISPAFTLYTTHE